MVRLRKKIATKVGVQILEAAVQQSQESIRQKVRKMQNKKYMTIRIDTRVFFAIRWRSEWDN